MSTERKKRIAEFRFGVIADLVGWRKLSWGERSRLLREKSTQEWQIPYSSRNRISQATIAKWVKRYEESGRRLSSLYPQGRSDKGTFRSLDEETLQTLLNLKTEMRRAPLPVILRQARVRKLLPVDFRVTPATIYRLFREHGLMDKETEPVDRRRFEAELANEIWQSDASQALPRTHPPHPGSVQGHGGVLPQVRYTPRAEDRTVSLSGRLYEAPVGLIGKVITLLYHDHDPSRVEVFLKDKSHGFLVPLDLHINSRIRRDRPRGDNAPKVPAHPEEKPHYTGGKLFDQEKGHDEL